MHNAPIRSRVLWFIFVLKNPFRTPKTTAAMLEIVTIWLTIAIDARFEEPKKALDKSTKKRLAKTSSMLVPKKTSAKEKINFLPFVFSGTVGSLIKLHSMDVSLKV
jgi:hypothetical protein